mgnify:CR=1 FL=1
MKKSKFKIRNIIAVATLIVAILTLIATIIGVYFTIIYRPKPYLYIEDVQLISDGRTIYGNIANGGDQSAKYIAEITAKDIKPIIQEGTLLPGLTANFTFTFPYSNLEQRFDFKIKIKYSPISRKDKKINYCTEYNFTYEDNLKNPTIINGSRNCN